MSLVSCAHPDEHLYTNVVLVVACCFDLKQWKNLTTAFISGTYIDQTFILSGFEVLQEGQLGVNFSLPLDRMHSFRNIDQRAKQICMASRNGPLRISPSPPLESSITCNFRQPVRRHTRPS
jgi:hypothetical protein